MLPRLVHGLILAMLSCALGSCSETSWYVAGPGPSNDIATSPLDRATLYGQVPVTTCVGPADEVAMLGSLCTRIGSNEVPTLHAGDLSLTIRADGGYEAMAPYAVVIFGYYGDGVVTSDHAADIRYAAFLVPAPSPSVTGSEWDHQAYARWQQGDPLTGAIRTYQARVEAAGTDTFSGIATFVWRNTTITFAFFAGFSA